MDRENATPDLIQQDMLATRASLTDKVAALESQVVGTLQSATDTVQTTVDSVQSTVASMKTAVEDTMSTVKGSVQDSVQAVTEQVKSTFDFSGHVRKQPWPMVGGAAAAGFVVGLLLPPAQRALFGPPALGFQPTPGTPTPPSPTPAASQPQPAVSYARAAEPAKPASPTWIDELVGMAGRELKKLGEEALASAIASLRESVHQKVPHLVETTVSSATNSLAQHLPGGGRTNGSNI